MAMDNRSIAAFIETKRTKMNSVIICLPSKGAGREKRQKQWHLRCIAAPPQARAEARKKCIPRYTTSYWHKSLQKKETSILKMVYQPPLQAWYNKLSNQASKTQIIQLVTQNWKLILKKPPMQTEPGVKLLMTRMEITPEKAAHANWIRS